MNIIGSGIHLDNFNILTSKLENNELAVGNSVSAREQQMALQDH